MEGQNLKLQDPVVTSSKAAEPATPFSAPVLVAVDFSSEAAAALTWACDYADNIGAPLEILHVIHDPGDSPGTYRADDTDPLEPIADVANRRLSRFVAEVGRSSPKLRYLEGAKVFCIEGLPVATILETAEARRARLLVMGASRRRNGLSRLIHSPTVQQVASRAAVPVTIVKASG